ncbi:hypothetical protein Pan241w_01450 [Gimesia alba]|uniref:Uncharacterized protein n=1 Tax=Gimesia alba TaxID=2527973 RepID=A0A517R890_9PLAN|nr:hypothetical protein [Gimesia alba]QDT40092.1 hypothetical protein Pan241w_01450 [Gimesia alba]
MSFSCVTHTQRPILLALLTLLLCPFVVGCASTPYQYQTNLITHPDLDFEEGEPQIVRGKPRKFVDGVGWVVGIPGKILLWNRRVDNHDISPETEAAIAAYLEKNGLDQVKVRINEYDPLGEWRRLRKNKAVGWGWRYTAGTLTALHYTLLPGRIIGGDNYNPFTNTISLYSDLPAVALHEGGHAKDFGSRKWKGTYAVAGALPGVSLWPEAIATNDALGYLRAEENYEDEQEAYRVLYPAYATYIAGAASPLLPYGDLVIKAGAVIPGHLAGRWKANEVRQEQIARHSQSGIQQVSAADPFLSLPEIDATDQSPIQQTHYQAMQADHDLFEEQKMGREIPERD